MIVWIGLGANLGDPRRTLARALVELEGEGLRLLAVSDLYRTAPLGPDDQPDFLNAVAEAETELEPLELLRRMKALETRLGRLPRARWREREIDLDLLLARRGDVWLRVSSEDLELPHPRLEQRAFVLAPLLQLRPDIVHPGTGRPLAESLGKPEIRAQGLRAMGEESGWYRTACGRSPSKA